jgi:hypothetical protein
MLGWLPKKHPEKNQEQDRSDDRCDEPDRLTFAIPVQSASDESGDEGAGYAEKNCGNEAARIFTRHEKLCDCPDDEANDDCPEYCHNLQGEASGG